MITVAVNTTMIVFIGGAIHHLMTIDKYVLLHAWGFMAKMPVK